MADQNFKVKKGLEVGIGGTVITTSSSGNVGLGTTNPTSKLWVNGDGYFIGSVTSAQGFYVDGELVGSGTISVGNIVGTGLSISGFSTVGVLSATSIGIGTTNAQQNLWVEGNGYFSGVVTATQFVGQLDAQSSQAQSVGFATTASNVIGGIASVTQLSVSGISTVGVLTATSIGIGTTNAQQNVWVEGNGYFSGVVTATQFVGQLDAQSGQAQSVGFATTASNVIGGIASVTALSVSGLSTVGVLTATSIGIGTTNPQQNLWVEGNGYFSGVVTATKFVGELDAQVALAQSVGFATTAINLEGGSQGSLPYQNSSGITSFLDGGADNQVLLYDTDTNKPKWGSAGDAQGAFPGIDVKDEDSTSVNNIKVLNFRGDNITAVSDSVSGVSTITIASNLVGTGLSISGISTLGITTISQLRVSGISTLGITTISQLRVSGISTVGVLTATSIGIGTTNPQQNLWVEGNGYFSGVVTATQFVGQLDAQSGQAQSVGFATTATNIGSGNTGSLPYQNAPGITSFLDAPGVGTTNQVLVYRDSTDQLVWTKIGLGTHTTGNYVREIYGTSNEIEVTPSTTGAGVTHRIGFSTSPTIQGTLKINQNLNVLGNITVGGTINTIVVEDLVVKNKDIILGFATNLAGNEVSTDFTATGGGIAIASTEGSALININAEGFVDIPSTYKKIMWFRANDPFVGLNTDAWLSNYAFGIGTTVMSVGTRFAAGNVQISQDDITAVRNINSTGISTFGNGTTGVLIDGVNGIVTSTNPGVTTVTFVGNLTGTASTASFATTAFSLNGFVPATGSVGFATTATDVIGGIGSLSRLSVSGVSTFGNSSIGVKIDGSTGIITSSNPGVTTVTYYGDGSKLSNIISGVSISTNTTNQTQLITYVTGTGSTAGFGVTTSGLVFNPSSNSLGIGTTNPSTPLQVGRYGVKTGFGTFVAFAGITTDVDSFVIATTDFKTAEYTVHIQSSSSIQAQKVLVMQNGTSAFSEEYAIMYDPNFVVSIGATVSGALCKLQFTPETGVSGLVTYRFTRETML